MPYSESKDLVDVIRVRQHKDAVSVKEESSYHLTVVPAAGYSLQTGLAAVLSGNLGFYTGSCSHANAKISSILGSVTYSQYRQGLYTRAIPGQGYGLSRNGIPLQSYPKWIAGRRVVANTQSFSKELSKQFSVIAPGPGVGLRIKLNKFSGANLCIDYGFGIEGSKGLSVNLGRCSKPLLLAC